MSRNSRGLLQSFGGEISFDGDYAGDDGEEAVEVIANSGMM